jgi:fused-like protein
LIGVFNTEQDPQVMTKVAVLRIITQMLRLRRDTTNELTSQASALLQNIRLPGEIMANS